MAREGVAELRVIGQAEVVVAAEARDPATRELVTDTFAGADRWQFAAETLGAEGVEVPANSLVQEVGHESLDSRWLSSYSAGVQASNADLVERGLSAAVSGFGLDPSRVRWDRLGQLFELWQRFGRAFNLSGSLETTGLLEHVLEGLQVVAMARRIEGLGGESWVDVGSGAGFPGLIVAACLEGAVTLIEPRERRASFLDMAVHAIGRGDCRVVRGHVESRGWKPLRRGDALEPGTFGGASARAVFAPEQWLEVGLGLVREGGIVALHVRAETPEIAGTVARVDGAKWSIRGVRR